MERLQAFSVHAVARARIVLRRLDQTCFLQNRYVLGNRGRGERQDVSQLAEIACAVGVGAAFATASLAVIAMLALTGYAGYQAFS